MYGLIILTNFRHHHRDPEAGAAEGILPFPR